MLKLLNSNVAIEPIHDPDTTPSGRIIIPVRNKGRVDQGIIKYVGPDVKQVKIGDYVIFSGYSGSLLSIEDEGTYIIMDEKFIACTIPHDEHVRIPGLFFRYKDDVTGNTEYIPASFEQSMRLIADTFHNTPLNHALHDKYIVNYETDWENKA